VNSVIENNAYVANRRTALFIGNSEIRREQLTRIAKICNTDVIPDDWPGPEDSTLRQVDLVLVDLNSISERYSETLKEMAGYLADRRTHALIWMKFDLLDEAYATLPNEYCHYLVDTGDVAAIPYLTGVMNRKQMDQLHDNGKDGEFGALHRISDELAAFAQTLARMAEQDKIAKNSYVADKPVSFRPAPDGAFQPFTRNAQKPEHESGQGIEVGTIREIIKLRRMRDEHFKSELFADPAWDILLDLMAARLEGKSVSVSSLCIAAAVPPTTALRWVTGMTESGMLVRRMDPSDARRVFIELSEETALRLDTFFKAAKSRIGFLL
jgi:DNA-binding MarR family transcriptional regulator